VNLTQEAIEDTTEPEIHHWIKGNCVAEHNQSAKIWKAHTSTETFAAAFNQITRAYNEDNELRTTKVEAFLIAEA
jgi:hypothetical protein